MGSKTEGLWKFFPIWNCYTSNSLSPENLGCQDIKVKKQVSLFLWLCLSLLCMVCVCVHLWRGVCMCVGMCVYYCRGDVCMCVGVYVMFSHLWTKITSVQILFPSDLIDLGKDLMHRLCMLSSSGTQFVYAGPNQGSKREHRRPLNRQKCHRVQSFNLEQNSSGLPHSKPADSYFTHNSYKANDFICQPKYIGSSSEGIHKKVQEAPACFIVIQFHSENIKEK